MKRILLFSLTIILLITVAACSSNKGPVANEPTAPKNATVGGKAVPTTASSKAAVTETEPTDEPKPADTPTDVAAEGTPAADAFTLDSRESGLEKLNSYRMRWLAEWSGTDDGKAETGSWGWVEEFVKEPRALHWTWNFEDPQDKTKSGNMEWWQIGDMTYMNMSEDECISMSSEDSSNQLNQGLFNPDMLGKVDDATYVGDETVNGIPAKHYKYDQKGATLSNFGEVAGEIWVAIDGGYVVKDVVAWKGGAGLFGASGTTGTKGEGKWIWELTDVDQPIEIVPPADCGGAANDLPIMADATDKTIFGDMVTYQTKSAIPDIVAFYKSEMVAAGWEETEDGMSTETMTSLNFSKDGQTAQVLITKDDDKTQVMINVTK